MPNELRNWNDTTLWKALESHQSDEIDAVRAAVSTMMPGIQTVLNQAGTSPTDFTLHDAQHSFRVAQRMTQLISAETLGGLSPYELALLLMSAYLHDIGMTPPQSRLKALETFLTADDNPEFSEEHKAD